MPPDKPSTMCLPKSSVRSDMRHSNSVSISASVSPSGATLLIAPLTRTAGLPALEGGGKGPSVRKTKASADVVVGTSPLAQPLAGEAVAHAGLQVQVTIAFLLEPALQGARVQAQALCHVLNPDGEHAGVVRDDFLDLCGHALPTGLLAQTLVREEFGLFVQGGKGAFQGQVEDAAFEHQRIDRLIETELRVKKSRHLVRIRRRRTLEGYRQETVVRALQRATELADAGEDGLIDVMQGQVQSADVGHGHVKV